MSIVTETSQQDYPYNSESSTDFIASRLTYIWGMYFTSIRENGLWIATNRYDPRIIKAKAESEARS